MTSAFCNLFPSFFLTQTHCTCFLRMHWLQQSSLQALYAEPSRNPWCCYLLHKDNRVLNCLSCNFFHLLNNSSCFHDKADVDISFGTPVLTLFAECLSNYFTTEGKHYKIVISFFFYTMRWERPKIVLWASCTEFFLLLILIHFLNDKVGSNFQCARI